MVRNRTPFTSTPSPVATDYCLLITDRSTSHF
jgi:hypothetical protein